MPALLLIACEPAPSSSSVSPDLAQYSPEFQKQAADELESLNKLPCPRDGASEHCSALHRLVIDYGWVRDEIRAILGIKV